MAIKNNVTRLLDARAIPYTAHELPKEKLGGHEAAAYLGVPPEQMVKSIVVLRPERAKPILALVSAPHEVDLKVLAVALNEKKLTLATQKEAEARTGLQVGGISPLALLPKGFQTVLDQALLAQDQIYLSGGQRGLNIQMSPRDLQLITSALVAPISRPAEATRDN